MIRTANSERIELPSSNVIKIHLFNQSWFAVRPSGTETKLKIYYSSLVDSKNQAHSRLSGIKRRLLRFENLI